MEASGPKDPMEGMWLLLWGDALPTPRLSRCSEDSQDTPAYFDKPSACREGLLIFAA